jgi:hypothetical protein
MRLLLFLPWRWLCALAITALFLLGIYQLSAETRYYSHRTFIAPIEQAFRSIW